MLNRLVAILTALIIHDLLKYIAHKLDWRWSVNRTFVDGPPIKVQIVRAIAGVTPRYGK